MCIYKQAAKFYVGRIYLKFCFLWFWYNYKYKTGVFRENIAAKAHLNAENSMNVKCIRLRENVENKEKVISRISVEKVRLCLHHFLFCFSKELTRVHIMKFETQ